MNEEGAAAKVQFFQQVTIWQAPLPAHVSKATVSAIKCKGDSPVHLACVSQAKTRVLKTYKGNFTETWYGMPAATAGQ